MTRFLIKRIVSAILLLFGLLTIIFLIAHLAPGDPVTTLLSPTIPSTVADELRHQFGLDQPIVVQYLHWLKNVVAGNLGVSFSHHRPVAQVIANVFPNTAILGLTAICLELILGVFLGMLAVKYHHSLIDKAISNAGLILYTLPTFWIGLVLLAVFSYGFGFFPSSQMHSIGVEYLSPSEQLQDFLWHLMLPALTIAIPGAAAVARYVRPSLLNVQGDEYVTFARSLGMPQQKIFFFYKLPNAMAPVITILGLELGALLAGALVTETIFAWPGLGRLAVMAMFARDYPLIMGCTLVSGLVVIVGNLIADLLYSIVDPRVRIA